jgi:AcrR family transcriptional regulator
MQSTRVIQDDQAVRDRIMAAALIRFRQYGYNKTTMAEIAADCDMSTANIYRYFANKQEIAGLCVANCIQDRIRCVEEVASRVDCSASERLRGFVLTLLQNCHDTWSKDLKIHELLLFITSEHPEIVHDKIARLQELLQAILEYGVSTGEFQVEDTVSTARAIYSSIAVFDIPLSMNFYPLQVFRARANEVVDLLLKGLSYTGKLQRYEEGSPP